MYVYIYIYIHTCCTCTQLHISMRVYDRQHVFYRLEADGAPHGLSAKRIVVCMLSYVMLLVLSYIVVIMSDYSKAYYI